MSVKISLVPICNDVLAYSLSFLPLEEQAKVTQVSKQFYNASEKAFSTQATHINQSQGLSKRIFTQLDREDHTSPSIRRTKQLVIKTFLIIKQLIWDIDSHLSLNIHFSFTAVDNHPQMQALLSSNNSRGWAVIWAAKNGYPSAAQVFLASGPISNKDKGEATAYASQKGLTSIAQALLNSGQIPHYAKNKAEIWVQRNEKALLDSGQGSNFAKNPIERSFVKKRKFMPRPGQISDEARDRAMRLSKVHGHPLIAQSFPRPCAIL